MDKNEIRNFIARRAAMELKDGDVVNLGIGLASAGKKVLLIDSLIFNKFNNSNRLNNFNNNKLCNNRNFK